MEDELTHWDLDKFLDSMNPAWRRNQRRRMRVVRIQMWLARTFRWPRWPLLNVIWTFWTCLMDEGIKETVAPRWGAMTFSYLNDGMRPSLYHTVLSVLRPNTPIYISRAPRKPSER